MNIALDYDDTFTLHPGFWLTFIELAEEHGIDVRIVTHRHPVLDRVGFFNKTPIYYTNGVAKKWWLEANTDWTPDVYIDDKPEGILNNSDKSKEWLAEWRATREG